jgi:hypothetical protein
MSESNVFPQVKLFKYSVALKNTNELSTEEYRKKNPINMDQVISNFQEAEERKLNN